MKAGVSVIVPTFDTPPERLARLFASLSRQTLASFEVILVDDGSRAPCRLPAAPADPRFRLLRQPHTGPAGARNAGAAVASGDVLFFTDSDCELDAGALEAAVEALRDADLSAGTTLTIPTTWFGRAVAYLGFPGGGLLGFDRVWRVDAAGFTSSVSGCNVAIRRRVFESLSGFDPTFPVAGGEDTVLAHEAVSRGHRIRYAPSQRASHPGRDDLASFVRWHLTRGRGTFHIARRIPTGRFLGLRLWSLGSSLRAAGLLSPLVLGLWVLMVLLQVAGHLDERLSHREQPLGKEARA